MADTAKKAESKLDETTEPESKTAEGLESGFDRVSSEKAWGELHEYAFADGTAAKVLKKTGDTHVTVQFLNRAGRATTATTTHGLTVVAANKLIGEAGQKAIDATKVEGS